MDRMEIAKTIMVQLRWPSISVYGSWGVSNPICLSSGKMGDGYALGGLAITVRGMLLRGRVEIHLMGDDTYTVRFFNVRYRMVKELTQVYCDELQVKIDEVIERV